MILSRRKRIFFSPKCPDQLWGPPNLVSVGIKGFYVVVQWQRHEANLSLASSVGAIPPGKMLL